MGVPADNCDDYCSTTGRPTVSFDGEEFRYLIRECTNDEFVCPIEFRNIPINCWNTNDVTSMSYAFSGAPSNFNSPLHCWDTSNVLYFTNTFDGASNFDQPINTWDTSSARGMKSMFRNAIGFNQQLDHWNTSDVTDMRYMFL